MSVSGCPELLTEVVGKKRYPVPVAAFAERLAAYPEVWIDLGTGDGQLVLALARSDQSRIAVGIDAEQHVMTKASRTAVRKIGRGGLEPSARGRNAVFIHSGFERLCQLDGLSGIADTLSVLCPWGSLLRRLSGPEPEACRCVYRLLKPKGTLRMVLNARVYQNEQYCRRLQLPQLRLQRDWERLMAGYRQQGFEAVCLSADLDATALRALPDNGWILKSQWRRRLGRRAVFLGFHASRAAA